MSSKKKALKKTPSVPAAPAPTPVPAEGPAPQAQSAPEAVLPLAGEFPARWRWLPPVLMVLFFLGTCLTTLSTFKGLTVTLVVVALTSCLLRFSYVRDRLSLPFAAVVLWMLMNGISCFYAVSGKFALRGFLRMLIGFCVLLLILAWSRRGRGSGRTAAAVLAGGTAIASLVSIDMLSTHWISVPVFKFLQDFSFDFTAVAAQGVEAGVRMTSIYENPNVFAGISGLGVLLGLELAVTARKRGERCFHLCCLFLNSLAFLLVFSMGASAMIALAFLALLIFERKERKGALLVLMVETLVLVLMAAFPIFLTSFDIWSGFQPVPLACALGGSALLCLLDCFPGQKAAGWITGRGGKVLAVFAAACFVILGVFAALAVSMTGPASLSAGESMHRAEYPQPGSYTLEAESTGDLYVTIQSQNQRETMMHTYTDLYSGPAQGAVFTVPEDSLVTHFHFTAGEDLTLESATFTGEGISTSLKLDYKLLPGFIANRLQGLFANQNAIQRTVFFADGMKLFRRSPIVGLGLGSYESSIQGVQSFFYETKYAHNHYIETLVTTGVVGLVIFVGMLALCALALWKNLRRKEGADPLSPALAAALIFMAGHAAVEVVLSLSFYLPMAFGVLGLICLSCADELPLLRDQEEAASWFVVGMCVLVLIYTVFLGLNMKAAKVAETNSEGDTYSSLSLAAKLDFFETNDYLLSYVYMCRNIDKTIQSNIYVQANKYAQRLAKADSNTIATYLADYYFSTGQPMDAIAMINKHVDFVSAKSAAWQECFSILETYSPVYPQCAPATRDLYRKFQDWNEENMGDLTLTEQNWQYIQSVIG